MHYSLNPDTCLLEAEEDAATPHHTITALPRRASPSSKQDARTRGREREMTLLVVQRSSERLLEDRASQGEISSDDAVPGLCGCRTTWQFPTAPVCDGQLLAHSEKLEVFCQRPFFPPVDVKLPDCQKLAAPLLVVCMVGFCGRFFVRLKMLGSCLMSCLMLVLP